MNQSKMLTAGLVVLGLMSVGNLMAPVLSGGGQPPPFVAFSLMALGAVGLACIVGVRKGSRIALTVLVATGALSALLAAPALFATHASGGSKAVAGTLAAAALIGMALVLAGRRTSAPVR